MIMLVCDGSKLELDEVVAKGLKLPENAMGEDPRGNITCHLPDITANVIMLVCDGSKLELDEVVAKGLKLPENAMGEDPRGNITCHLPDITANVMAMVIDYCKNPKAHIDKNIGPVFLFDLIQAAHYFEIKTLMDLTCQTLVSMVKMKSVREIREEFTNQKYEPSKRAQSSTERIKRLHERETFIKPSTSVYVQRSRCVTAALSSIDRRKSRFDVSAVNLLKNYKSKKDLMAATYSLSFSLERARELGDRLQYNHIVLLVGILEEQESQKQCTSADSHLKVHVLEILSRVSSTALKDAMTEARFQLLLKIIRDSDYAVAHRAVVTLTNIVKVLPEVIVTVVANGALTCVNTAVLKYRGLDMMDGVAMFLITVCRTADLSHHVVVEVAVGTLLDLLEAPLFAEKACYALQYLTYGKELRIYAAMSRKLIKNLIEFIKKPLYCSCEFPGYALAVVGNIARWGSSVQIEILTSECRILEELGSIINAHGKKIQKEACQIISNIAATKEGSLREIHTARLTDPLCSLLEKDEADVKMEGVWAIYNSIYGSKFDPSIALSPR